MQEELKRQIAKNILKWTNERSITWVRAHKSYRSPFSPTYDEYVSNMGDVEFEVYRKYDRDSTKETWEFRVQDNGLVDNYTCMVIVCDEARWIHDALVAKAKADSERKRVDQLTEFTQSLRAKLNMPDDSCKY